MDKMRQSIFLILSALALASAAPSFPGSADHVTKDLPGQPNDHPITHYSGYLESVGGVQLHYWLFESQSSPSTDPIVLWLNGGPGCSSMLGALAEHGPFRLERSGKLSMNEYAWNKNATVLYLESPAGVGYSYNASNRYKQNDRSTIELNRAALKSFFVKFPQFSNSRFFISGESYGGIYVPQLAESLIANNFRPKLEGVLIGNGYFDADLLGNSLAHYKYYHGIIKPASYREIVKACCKGVSDMSECKIVDSDDRDCRSAARVNMAGGIFALNPYNIYDKCYESGFVDPKMQKKMMSANRSEEPEDQAYSYEQFGQLLLQDQLSGLKLKAGEVEQEGGDGDDDDPFFNIEEIGPGMASNPPCEDQTYVSNYLNKKETKEALHISASSNDWAACRSVGYSRSTRNVHQTMMKLIEAGVRVHVYAGDADTACNWIGNEWFVEKLGLKELDRGWNPIYTRVDGSFLMGGMRRQWEKNVSFDRVAGAGHMVPTDRPEVALKMINWFIHPQPE